MIKKLILSLTALIFSLLGLAAVETPDFVVSDILVRPNKFIYIKLQNRSSHSISLTKEQGEQIFLTLYINNIKRAEYKAKYLDKRLWQGNSTIYFRTNFRLIDQLKIKVEINRERAISESLFNNNSLEKSLN
jgi:hypothetical protein